MEMKLVAFERRINRSRRRGDAESTPESTHGGGRWQLGMPVQRGVLRSTCGNSRMSSRAMSRAFSRTKYGSRGCSLSRDSTVGTQENSRTQEFASIRPDWWDLRPHRRTGTMVRTRISLRTVTKSVARPPTTREHGLLVRRWARSTKKRPPGVLHEGQIADSSGRSKVGLCPTWARRVLLHTRRLGRTRSPWMLGHQRPPARRCGNGACRPGRGASAFEFVCGNCCKETGSLFVPNLAAQK